MCKNLPIWLSQSVLVSNPSPPSPPLPRSRLLSEGSGRPTFWAEGASPGWPALSRPLECTPRVRGMPGRVLAPGRGLRSAAQTQQVYGCSSQYYLKLPCSWTWTKPCDCSFLAAQDTFLFIALWSAGLQGCREAGATGVASFLPLTCGTTRARVPPGPCPAGPALQETALDSVYFRRDLCDPSPVVFNCVISV